VFERLAGAAVRLWLDTAWLLWLPRLGESSDDMRRWRAVLLLSIVQAGLVLGALIWTPYLTTGVAVGLGLGALVLNGWGIYGRPWASREAERRRLSVEDRRRRLWTAGGALFLAIAFIVAIFAAFDASRP